MAKKKGGKKAKKGKRFVTKRVKGKGTMCFDKEKGGFAKKSKCGLKKKKK